MQANQISATRQQAVAKAPAPEKKNELSAFVTAATNRYMSEIGNLSTSLGLGGLTDSAKRCGSNLIIYIAAKYGKDAFSSVFTNTDVIQALQFVTINELDVFSSQVFLDVRDEWKDGHKTGKKTLAATVQGTGLENMVRRFGVGVKSLHGPYIVHDGDEFTMPCFDGTKMTPPVLKPKMGSDSKKAMMVYYLIEKDDGTTEMASASRETVARNLGAAILNAALKDKNLDREALMSKFDGKSLDEMLSDNYLNKFISPAYKSPSSREQMIITKMRKNALLHYTRDLGARSLLGAESLKGDGDMLASNVVATSTGEEEEVGEKIADISMEEPKKLEAKADAKPAADEPKADENGEAKPEPVKVAAAAEDDPFDI